MKEAWIDPFGVPHPMTIIKDRYGGTYSGGAYLAFGCEHTRIPDGVNGDDCTAASAWGTIDHLGMPQVGKGRTIVEAVGHLMALIEENIKDEQTKKV